MTKVVAARGHVSGGRGKAWSQAAALGLLATAFCAGLAGSGATRPLDGPVTDALLRLRAPRPAVRAGLERVVVVGIDDESVADENLGLFSSWSRSYLADVVEYLSAAGVKGIGIDLLLAEPDRLFPQDDRRLAAAIAASGRVVLARAEAFRRGPAGEVAERIEPLPALAAGARALGQINLFPRGEGDRTARTYPFAGSLAEALARLGDRGARTPASEVLDPVDPAHEGAPEERSFVGLYREAASWRALRDKLAEGSGLADSEAEALASLLGLPEASPEELGRALRDRVEHPAPELLGKLVVLGPTATGLGDFYHTPFGTLSGPQIHAAAVLQVLDARELTPLAPTAPAALVPTLLLAVPAAAAGLMGAGWLQLLVLPAAALVPVAAAAAALVQAGVLVAPLAASLAGLAGALAGLLFALARERAARAQVRQVFGRFVAPAVVERLADHPELARPGGTLREVTLVTADIRGFTRFSEGRDPGQVSAFLNRYFEEMVAVLWDHGATVDKFMGDGILAFFNAPLEQPDHALRGIKAALAMVDRAERLAARLALEGSPGAGFRIGVAVNTGICLVGNLGAARVMGYTAIGDAVNTAARIEGLNAELGTSVLVGPATVEKVRGMLPPGILVPAGVHALKGKAQPLEVHQVVPGRAERKVAA